jgi:hypothetical protein
LWSLRRKGREREAECAPNAMLLSKTTNISRRAVQTYYVEARLAIRSAKGANELDPNAVWYDRGSQHAPLHPFQRIPFNRRNSMDIKGIKSAVHDLNWKTLLLEKGEKLGLSLAGGLTTLLIVPFLWYLVAGNGPSANAELLKSPTDQLESRLASSQPAYPDNPPTGDTIIVIRSQTTGDTTPYQLAPLTSGGIGIDASKRDEPRVLVPSAVVVAVNLTQVDVHAFNTNLDKIFVDRSSKAGLRGSDNGANPYRGGTSFPGSSRPGTGPGNFGISQASMSGVAGKKELVPELIPLEKLADQRTIEKVLPLRQVELTFAFPLRAQVAEFVRRLRLVDENALLADRSGERDARNQPLPSFRFMGFHLKRQKLDRSGVVLQDWTEIDLNASFKPYLFLNGKRFQEDPPELDAIKFPGLMMPRLRAMNADQYPRIELELEQIAETLKAMSNTKASSLPIKKTAGPDTFDIFDPKSGDSPSPSPPGNSPSDTSRTPVGSFPEYCLGRAIDLTVEPGFTYRYQIKIKMGNPNKALKNVLSPHYASKPFLVSEWYEIMQDVIVPQETYFYAVDQKATEKDYKGQNANYTVQKDRQAVFQIHKWLESTWMPNNDRETVEIGEWVVAERVPVFRGEYLGRSQRVQVPAWRPTRDAFVLLTEMSNDPNNRGVSINFSQPDGSDLILVDFFGGEAKYDLLNGKGQITQPCATETIVLGTDGRLLAHDSAIDLHDKERVNRLTAYRQRIKELSFGAKPGDGSPFNGSGKGGGQP